MWFFKRRPKYVQPSPEEMTFIPETSRPTVKLTRLGKYANRLPRCEQYFEIVPMEHGMSAVAKKGRFIGVLDTDRGVEASNYAYLAWINKRVPMATGVVRDTKDGVSVSLKIRTGNEEYSNLISFHRQENGWRFAHEIEEAAEPWSWPWGDEYIKLLQR